jgi:hypothetical protein
MPVDLALIASWQGKPRDLGRSVADRDQRHATGLAAAQANARDLVKRHVDHPERSQPVLLRLAVFRHGKESCERQRERTTITHCNLHELSGKSRNGLLLHAPLFWRLEIKKLRARTNATVRLVER